MKLKVVVAFGVAVGGVVWAAWRKTRQEQADAALWSEATDPVVRFGDR